jgi:hypothetical protein
MKNFPADETHPHTVLHCDVLGVMRGVGFAPNIALSLMAKKQHFSLI